MPDIVVRHWRWFAFLVAVVFAVDFFVVKNLIFDLALPAILGSAYDDLAASLLRGEITVRMRSIRWEYFMTEDRVFMYFGPFPALLRIVPNLLFPDMAGHWSRISCLIAALMGQLSFLWMSCTTLGASERLREKVALRTISLLFLAFSFGLPFPFLLTAPAIYHEAILWAFASSILAICSITSPKILSARHVWVFTIASAMAFLSKPTFGIPLYLLSGVLFIAILYPAPSWLARRTPEFDGLRSLSFGRRAAVFAPIVVAGLFHAWYNLERFGGPFTFLDYAFYHGGESRDRNFLEGALAFDVFRLPYVAYYYFVTDFNFEPTFPFVRYVRTSFAQHATAGIRYHEPVLALLVSCGWFVAMGIWGLVRRTSEMRSRWLFRITALLLLVQCVLILSFFIMALRYSTELMPILLLGVVLLMRDVAANGFGRFAIPKQIVLTIAIAVAIGVQLSIASQHLIDARPKLFSTDEKIALLHLFNEKGWLGRSMADYRTLHCFGRVRRDIEGEYRLPEGPGSKAARSGTFEGSLLLLKVARDDRNPDGWDCHYKVQARPAEGGDPEMLRFIIHFDEDGEVQRTSLAPLLEEDGTWVIRERVRDREVTEEAFVFEGGARPDSGPRAAAHGHWRLSQSRENTTPPYNNWAF